MELITNIFWFIIVIGILVAIHEFGHFIAARFTGMRAEIFSVGMGKRLFGFNKINGFTTGKLPEDIELENHTDYRLSLFPIGGYVKISGMVDESFDDDFSTAEIQPYEFRSKKTWQKALVLSAGVIMNMILAIAVYSGIAFFNGEQEIATTTIGSIENESAFAKSGLMKGDRIIKVNGNEVKYWNEFMKSMTIDDFGNDAEIEFERNGSLQKLNISSTELIKDFTKKKSIGVSPGNIKISVEMVQDGMPAAQAGIIAGDTIIKVNNTSIDGFNVLQNTLKSYKNEKVAVQWKRSNRLMQDSLIVSESGIIGIGLGYGPVVNVEYGFIQSLAFGWNATVNATEFLISSIGQMFKGSLSVKESIGGPIMIMQQAGQQAERGLLEFLEFLALLSISLAFMNILPLPALDGGHLVFVLIEGIIRREVSTKVKMRFQQAGVMLLLLLMIFVFYIDISRFF